MIRRYDPYTYRHPRTLIDAFGCDASSACAIIRYKRKMNFWDKAVLAVAGILLFATAIMYSANP